MFSVSMTWANSNFLNVHCFPSQDCWALWQLWTRTWARREGHNINVWIYLSRLIYLVVWQQQEPKCLLTIDSLPLWTTCACWYSHYMVRFLILDIKRGGKNVALGCIFQLDDSPAYILFKLIFILIYSFSFSLILLLVWIYFQQFCWLFIEMTYDKYLSLYTTSVKACELSMNLHSYSLKCVLGSFYVDRTDQSKQDLCVISGSALQETNHILANNKRYNCWLKTLVWVTLWRWSQRSPPSPFFSITLISAFTTLDF